MTMALPSEEPLGQMMDLCVHEITAAFCTWCKDKNKPERKNERAWSRAATGAGTPFLEATFDSDCPWCGDLIEEGDPIAQRMDQWVCAGCASAFDNHPSNGA